jgi:hypothetical protein
MIPRILLPALCASGIFALANGASYFVRSDGYGWGVVHDGIRRCGFPVLFWQQGGYIAHEYFYPAQLGVDVLFGLVVGVLLSVFLRRWLGPT